MGAELTSDRVDLGNGVDLVHVIHPEPIMGGAVTSAQQPITTQVNDHRYGKGVEHAWYT